MTTGKTIVLTRQTFVGKVMSLLLNMLSRLVITFLPRRKCLLISWLQSPSAVVLEPKKIKSVTVSPSICHEVMRSVDNLYWFCLPSIQSPLWLVQDLDFTLCHVILRRSRSDPVWLGTWLQLANQATLSLGHCGLFRDGMWLKLSQSEHP